MDSTKLLAFSCKLQSVEVGHIISIRGKTTNEAENIEFFLGTLESESVVFRLAVKFAEPAILRSCFSLENGWSEEEKEENMVPNNESNPIKPGQIFKVSIYVDTETLFVNINGKPYCFFPYNGNIADIQRLQVFGDVEAIYEIDHSNANPETNNDDAQTFATTIPSFDKNVATVVAGTARGSPEGKVVIYLHDSGNNRVLIKLLANFEDSKIIVNSGDEVTR